MVSLPSAFGALFFLLWGTCADNLRTRLGRRRPVLVAGLALSGLLVIAFGAYRQYWLCLLLDGVVLMATANVFWSARPALVADLEQAPARRGRLNSNLLVASAAGGALTYAFVFLGDRDSSGAYTAGTHAAVMAVTAVALVAGPAAVAILLREPGL
ncbi:MAG: hypothetical protein Kow0069_15640 [Promethearchaeota archaeon]